MKTFRSFTFLLLFAFAADSFAQSNGWVKQQSEARHMLYDVFFANANTGTAVGDSGAILHTTNGGAAWSEQSSGTTFPLRGVFFTDANTGFAVGGGDRNIGQNNYTDSSFILRTTNGGIDWVNQSSADFPLNAVFFINANTGYAVGEHTDVSTTTDGGLTWGSIWWLGYSFKGVYFTDDTTGTIVGNSGVIFHTTNSNTGWTPQPSGTQNDLYGVSFIDANTGIAVGDSGTILRTTNDGMDWVLQPSGTTNALHAIKFTNATTGMIVGDAGTILRTTNGGTTWEQQASGTTQDLNGISMVNGMTATIVGDSVILHTTTGGVTDVKNNSAEIPEQFTLSQNFPNPAESSTNIDYSLTQSGYVSLKIYDVLGKEVATLVNGDVSAGEHTTQWHPHDLPGGVYFYRLVYNSKELQTKRLFLME